MNNFFRTLHRNHNILVKFLCCETFWFVTNHKKVFCRVIWTFFILQKLLNMSFVLAKKCNVHLKCMYKFETRKLYLITLLKENYCKTIGLGKTNSVCKNNGNIKSKLIFTWRNQKYWVKFSRTVNRVWRQPKPLILSPPISSFSIQHKIRSNSPFIPHRFVTVWWIIQKLRHFNNSPFSNINILTINYVWLKSGNCQTKKMIKHQEKWC